MLVNTQYFRQEAIFYNKYGHYNDGEKDTIEYNNFWDREYDRCIDGYKVGDTWVTGYHYWYLNYWKIMLNRESAASLYGEVTKTKKIKKSRVESFPDFWDVDFEFFHEIEKAERNSEHFVWLKPRGVGASFKGSGMAGRNFFLVPKSKSFLAAYEKEFLIKDGLLNKFVEGREAINKKHPIEKDRYMTAFSKPSDYKKDFNGMVYRASTNVDGEEQGYMSEVMGISFKDNYEKGRGKRGLLMLWEELGKFPNADKSWNIARSSFEEGGGSYGLMLGFGTGGTEGADFAALEKMFYDPESYNIRVFDNIWDEELLGTKCGYFTPAYRDVGFKDEQGNSLVEKAKSHYDAQRKLKAKSNDSNTLLQEQAEKPYNPQEAILNISHNILPKVEARSWRLNITANKLHELGIPGELKNLGEEIVFKPNYKLKPITSYENKKGDDLEGCVVQYFPPYKIDGKVPDNLYIIGHDPYAHDQTTSGKSIGATYVYMNANRLAPPGDKIVATYFGRPETQDDYNKILFNLSLYYNAKIGFENDRGDVIGYAKRFKLLDRLEEEFELAYDANLKGSKVRRKYGMHMGSGKNNPRKNQGDKYLADWLILPRGQGEDGKTFLNLHTIYCTSTLQEIERYNDTDNFDRISALRILQYHMKELDYKQKEVRKPQLQHNPDSLFSTALYQ